MSDKIAFSRTWAMPNRDTFSIPPIGCFVKKYLLNSKVSIDPFARNKRWCTYTNDLNPDTAAAEHMDAADFMLKYKDKRPDLVIFDPPYSPRQITECYSSIGIKATQGDTQSGFFTRYRNVIREISQEGTIVLSFGWNSCGMGTGWEILEIMLCAHGGAHNDTICMAERKLPDLCPVPMFDCMASSLTPSHD